MIRDLGLDLDSHDGFIFTKTVLNARRFGKVSTEYTKKGFHIKIRLSRPVSHDQALDIRRLLCDDPKRLEYDEFRLRVGDLDSFDTLFDWKKGYLNQAFIPAL